MRPKDDEILAEELGRMGGIGAKWVARKLPAHEYEMSADITASATDVLHYAEHLLASQGTLQNALQECMEAAPLSAVAAVVGSGFFDLNPTIVTIEVQPASQQQCRVRIHATAKEGLIKQRSAEKAVKRVAQLMFPPAG